MTLVRIVKDWDFLNPLRQTPQQRGIWDGIQFTLDPVEVCDYAIVLNRPHEDTTVVCPAHHVWAVMQEPPNEMFGLLHRGDPAYAKIFTTDERLQGGRYRLHQPAIAWEVKRDYDFLGQCLPPPKERSLSWITSNLRVFRGHRDRLRFLAHIQGRVAFDLFGRGFTFIDDKWDGLAPYRYSLAIENHSNNYYWSEKLADCFLAWTMPIYYGCNQIEQYFPPEAMIRIDIHDPDVVEKIRQAVSSDAWRRNQDAIAEARQWVLNRYQLFPFLAGEIQEHEALHLPLDHAPQAIDLPRELRVPLSPIDRLRNLWRSVTSREMRQRIAKVRQRFE